MAAGTWHAPSQRGWLQGAGRLPCSLGDNLGPLPPDTLQRTVCLLGPCLSPQSPPVTTPGAGAAGAWPGACLRSAPNSSEHRTPHVHITCLNKIPGRFSRFLMRGNMQRPVPFPKGHGDPEPAASHLDRWRLGLTVLLRGAMW